MPTMASSSRAPQTAASRGTVTMPPRNHGAAARETSHAARLAPTVARWPLEADEDLARPCGDAAMSVVRSSLLDYRSGRADAASRAWDDGIEWTVRGSAPFPAEWNGPDGVFAYHARLAELSGGTYRQRLIALEGNRGPMVTAYLRTTASRAGRELDIPSLAVFELAAGRIRRVTELPGDLAAWESFWA
jgi:hypothetical protein